MENLNLFFLVRIIFNFFLFSIPQTFQYGDRMGYWKYYKDEKVESLILNKKEIKEISIIFIGWILIAVGWVTIVFGIIHFTIGLDSYMHPIYGIALTVGLLSMVIWSCLRFVDYFYYRDYVKNP